MKRQRRTLGLLLVWLAIALGTIGLGPQPALRSPSSSARSAVSAERPDFSRSSLRIGARCPSAEKSVATGSLAWLAADRRSSAGNDLVLAINAAEGGFGESTTATHGRRFAWTDDAPRACGVRLGWSGCTAYRCGSDYRSKTASGADALATSAHWLARAIAAVVRGSSSALAPWLDSLAFAAPHAPSPASRVSRRSKPGEAQQSEVEQPSRAVGRTAAREPVL